jgi:hypothetical protein
MAPGCAHHGWGIREKPVLRAGSLKLRLIDLLHEHVGWMNTVKTL